MRDRFRTFLERSLALLEMEKPDLYRRMCSRLDGMTLAMRIDREPVTVSFRSGCRVERGSGVGAAVRVSSTRAAIVDVISGSMTLEDAVLAERVALVGTVAHLVRFHEGLRLYLCGAVRAPRFSTLLDEYLAQSSLARS